MKKIWHNYILWEDFQNGMYEEIKENKEERINDSIELLKDPERLKIIMFEVIDNWVISSEQFLSHKNSNRQAWLGQAACNYAHKATESETRMAWRTLEEKDTTEANRIADIVIREWDLRYEKRARNNNI